MVAIVPPQELKDELRPYCSNIDRLHITIASLGEIEDIQGCWNSLFGASYILDPIDLSIEGIGYVPVYGGQHACVAMVNGLGLDVWRYEIAKRLRYDGFLKDERHGFLPHMTLCRGTGFFDLEEFPVHWSDWRCQDVWLFQGYDFRMRFKVGGA
jgi:2'-5' RNA ligase